MGSTNKKKILIAIPSYGAAEMETFRSIYNMDRCGHEVSFDFVRGYLIDAERNSICEMAINGGYDYMLQVDSDVVLPPDALRNLLDPETDIVMGVYTEKRYIGQHPEKGGHTNAHKLGVAHSYILESSITYAEFTTPRMEIKGGGTGCLLVSTAALQKMRYPWFKFVEYPSREHLSEDLYFCEQAHAHGIPVWLDTRVRCGHINRQII